MAVRLWATEVHALPSQFTTATYKALLLVSPADPTPGTDTHVDDVSADELTVASYARATLGTKTVTADDAAGTTVMDCADMSFGSAVAGETAVWLVVYREVTNDADSPLVFAGSVSRPTDGTPVTVAVSSSGLVTVTNDPTGCP